MSCGEHLGAAIVTGLYRRTGDGAVAAIDAAIAPLGLQYHPAALAIVEILARIRRHFLDRLVPAL